MEKTRERVRWDEFTFGCGRKSQRWETAVRPRDGHERIALRIDTDPVVRELDFRRRLLYLRHVTGHTRRAGRCGLVAHLLVAPLATRVIWLRQRRKGRMRVMASQTRKTARAIAETR